MDNIKEFISRYCGYVGNYVQMNKEDVKEKLKNIIDRL